jgi:surfactin synthase thioesterase subunit
MEQALCVFLLGHAGGFAQAYQTAFQAALKRPDLAYLAERIHFEPLELPGHGSRLGEDLLTDLLAMEADVRSQLLQKLNGQDYAIFGHSLGGLLAYLLGASLTASQVKEPKFIFLSSSSIPGHFTVDRGLLRLGDRDFWRACQNHFGVINAEAAKGESFDKSFDESFDKSLMELFIPILRADLGAILNHSQDFWPSLDSPVAVFYAEGDTVTGLDMAAWQRFVRRPLELFRLAGGHFHPLESPEELLPIIGLLLDENRRPT